MNKGDKVFLCIVVVTLITGGSMAGAFIIQSLEGSTVMGTVINVSSYTGAGELNGFAHGMVTSLTYTNVTIMLYAGLENHHAFSVFLTCNYHHIGDPIKVWSAPAVLMLRAQLTVTDLPPGCLVG